MKTLPVSTVALLLLLLLTFAVPGSSAAEESNGRETFLAAKCETCHGVAAVNIVPKVKSEKMWGPDLGGYTLKVDFATFAAYARKTGELDGKQHKKEFKGTDEELQAILDWLATLEAKSE